MANGKKTIERLDRGDYEKWSDNMERLARAARRRSRVEAITQHAAGISNQIWDLSEEPGKYIDNTVAACVACFATSDAQVTAANYLDEHAGEVVSILADLTHPSRNEAIELFLKLQKARYNTRSSLTALEYAIELMDAAYRRGNQNKKAR